MAAHRGDTLLSEDQVGRRQTFGRACGAAASRSKLRPARPGALAARPRDRAAAAHSGGAMALHPALHTGRSDRALAIPEDRDDPPSSITLPSDPDVQRGRGPRRARSFLARRSSRSAERIPQDDGAPVWRRPRAAATDSARLSTPASHEYP